jgi:uncharacterized protein DUF6496
MAAYDLWLQLFPAGQARKQNAATFEAFRQTLWVFDMAEKNKRRYSRRFKKDVKSEMHRYKCGKAKSKRGGKGGKVKGRRQAIAIGLSKARRKGKKVSRKKR